MDKNRSAKQGGGDAPLPTDLKLDADQDELREKFGIVRVRLLSLASHTHTVLQNCMPQLNINQCCALVSTVLFRISGYGLSHCIIICSCSEKHANPALLQAWTPLPKNHKDIIDVAVWDDCAV